MPDETPQPSPNQPQVLQVREVTPLHPQHCLFGRVLTILRQDGEFIIAVLKDLVHDIQVRLHSSEIKPVVTPNIQPPAQPNAVVPPLSEVQAAAVEAQKQEGGA